jgi:hypothetical protein
LSISNHFPPIEFSKLAKPVMLPPGSALDRIAAIERHLGVDSKAAA